MKRFWLALTLVLLGGSVAQANDVGGEAWPWSDDQDAVAAAPDSHRVLLENDRVRVLEVVIRPGEREPPHTHRWSSVMMVTQPARIRYYDAAGELVFDSPPRQGDTPSEVGADWMGPERLHAVENIDDRSFRALRVELKEPR